MIYAVEVGVALSRPPRTDRISRVLVEVPHTGSDFTDETNARLVATWMAMRPDVVMPTYSRITDLLEI